MPVKSKRYNLILARTAVITTATIILVVLYFNFEEKNNTYTHLSTQLNSETKRFKTLSDKTLLVTEYEEEFNKFMPIKQYETENRLYFLDALDKIRIKNKIPKLNYSIGAQKPYKYNDGIMKKKGLNAKVSEVTLSMSLMHSADLVNIVRDLKNIKSSLHVVSSCELERLSSHKQKTSRASKTYNPNLKASCLIKWFTFKVI